MKRFMMHLSYAAGAMLIGFFITLIFYVVGYPFVRPALYLAGLFVEDRGGDSLMAAFIVINTTLSAIAVYVVIVLVSRIRQN